MFNCLGEVNEVQSSVPSHMKRISTLDVKTDGSLKVKRRTLLTSSTSKEKIQRDGQASFHPVTVREAIDLEDDTESTKTPEIPENVGHFQHGLTSGKFLNHYFP